MESRTQHTALPRHSDSSSGGNSCFGSCSSSSGSGGNNGDGSSGAGPGLEGVHGMGLGRDEDGDAEAGMSVGDGGSEKLFKCGTCGGRWDPQ